MRHELSQGRIPPHANDVSSARLTISGWISRARRRIQLGDKQVEADRVTASVKGPSSEISFEVFFLKDRSAHARLVRVPLALGTFSMELVR